MKASDKKIKREEPLSVELMIATVSQNDDVYEIQHCRPGL